MELFTTRSIRNNYSNNYGCFINDCYRLGPILTLLAVDKFILSGQLNSLFILLLLLGIVYFLSSLFNYLSGFIMVSISEKALLILEGFI